MVEVYLCSCCGEQSADLRGCEFCSFISCIDCDEVQRYYFDNGDSAWSCVNCMEAHSSE